MKLGGQMRQEKDKWHGKKLGRSLMESLAPERKTTADPGSKRRFGGPRRHVGPIQTPSTERNDGK